MIILKTEVYKCEYCGKKMIWKGAMSLHERQCRKNPKNKHKCFQYCKFLNKDECSDSDNRVFYCGNDKCVMYNKDLYSYKLERFESGRQRIKDDKLTRMPLICPFYQIEGGHDEDYIKSLIK